MKKIAKFFSIAVAVVLLSIMYAQPGISAPTPISTFPFQEDFETGTLLAETEAQSASQSTVSVHSFAANDSSYGVMMEGGPRSWGATPTTVAAAFAYTEHVSSLELEIIPSGVTGYLLLEFDHRQCYSFNRNYSWFRVLVNGSPVPDVDGNEYYQGSSSTSDNWKTLRYDLSAYINDASISVTLQASNKYRFQYYREGDLSLIDNLHIYYLEVTDDDNIDDDWEIFYFGNLTTADDTTDYDKDGYSDLQEFINQQNGETDPEGQEYDPTVINAVGGTGYAHVISTFPFEVDFEEETLPVAIRASWGSESSVYVTADAANNSGAGVMMEGNTYSGWFGNSTSTSYEQAYVDNHIHISTLDMAIIPSGANDNLVLEFDHRQNYSFGPAYSWFRVLVNGSPIMDDDGNEYFNPSSPVGDGWNTLRYDLTPYQNDASISVTLQASNKYYFNYQGSGDVSMIDNLRVLYLRIGDEDNDGIDDDWEIVYFGNLTTADATTDFEGDGYSDLQEFINQNNGEKDPEGEVYDPTVQNAAGGTGYIFKRSRLWLLITPVLLNEGR